jgi:hypothetical protein
VLESQKIVVVGPCAPSRTFSWNTAAVGDLRGPLREQAFLGSYHAVPGPFPEAYAAKCAAALNRDPIVEVYAADRWRIGALRRRLRVPDHWLESTTEKRAWAMVSAEAARLVVVTESKSLCTQPVRC